MICPGILPELKCSIGKDTALAAERLVFFTHCVELGPMYEVASAIAGSICCLRTWCGALSHRSIRLQLDKVREPMKSRWQSVLEEHENASVSLVPKLAAQITHILSMDADSLDLQMQRPSTMIFCTEGLRLLNVLLSHVDTRQFLVPLLGDMAFAARLHVAMTSGSILF